MGSALPNVSLIVKLTTGFCPAALLLTPVITIESPVIKGFGFCGYVKAVSEDTTCAPRIDASKGSSPFAMWQFWHWLSSGCGPPAWLTPLEKATSSWQEPQAARVGSVM